MTAKEEKAAFVRNSYLHLKEWEHYPEPIHEGHFTIADIKTSSTEESINSCPYTDGPDDISSKDNIEGHNMETNDAKAHTDKNIYDKDD